MSRKHGWLLVLVVLALLVAACGPEMATPTAHVASDTESSPTAASAGQTAEPEPSATETEEAELPTSGELPVDADDWHVLGSPDAQIAIVEYSDFQWPYCARYVRETFPQILETYIESGQVQYVFRNFPLYSIHPQAQKAAEAAECAGEQGKFWEMHDLLFENQGEWSGQQGAEATFKGLAGELGLDQAKFDACLDGGTYAEKVGADYQEGVAAGVSGTPAFRINGLELSGAQPFAAFQQQIEYLLAGGEPPTLEVAADSFRSMGDADAPVVITEFSDYQWPACGSVAREVIPDLIEQYVDTGKVRYVYREFPLASHPAAQKASEAAVCAGQQGEYWAMNEKLFSTTGEWGAQEDPTNLYKSYAQELGLDTATFNDCLDSGEAAAVVQADLMAGEMFGVNATPYFFVNELPIRGGLSIEALGKVIDYAAAGGSTLQILPAGEDPRVRGDRQTARAVAVAFVDYANPESTEHARTVLPELMEQYVDSGELLYVIHPLSDGDGGPGAQAAAAVECAGQQGKYWEMHDRLFEEQGTWTSADDPASRFSDYASALDLNIDKFEECQDSEWASLRVLASTAVAAIYGIADAPTYLFNDGQGPRSLSTFEEFEETINAILGQ